MSSPRYLEFHYTLRDAQGRVMDTSHGNPPTSCIEGAGQVIDGMERALRAMQAGDSRKIAVAPEQGYGAHDAALVQKVRRQDIPVDDLKVGDQFQTGPDRHAPVVTIAGIEGDEVLLDANHPLAGQTLFFEIQLVSARPATAAEIKAAREVE